jgi:hypothetical protein
LGFKPLSRRAVDNRKPKSTPVWAAARLIAPSTPLAPETASTLMSDRLGRYG